MNTNSQFNSQSNKTTFLEQESQSTGFSTSGGQQQAYVSQVQLPTQTFTREAAIHEQIREETVEEIQPILNVERYKTEVIQKTQPLIDREVRPVNIQQQTLGTQILPEVTNQGTGAPWQQDSSSVNYLDTAKLIVEKPALIMETEKKQIVEEIQPVIYKETIVPSVIKATQPIYQKIVEGTTYAQEVLPVQQLSGSNYSYQGSNQFSGSQSGQFDSSLQQDLQSTQFSGNQSGQFGSQSNNLQSGMTKQETFAETTTSTNAPYQPVKTL